MVNMGKSCHYCTASPYGDTKSMAQQTFMDKAISYVKLNPKAPKLLTAVTWNIPEQGANSYRVIGEINYCPMCGRNIKEANNE